MTSSYQVGVIPCMQSTPLAIAVSVLEKHGLHMLLGNWEFLSLPYHHSIHEDNMHAFLSPMQPQANCAISVIQMDAPTREEQVSFVGKSDAEKVHLRTSELTECIPGVLYKIYKANYV